MKLIKTNNKSITFERQRRLSKIAKILSEKPYVKVNELAEMFNLSETTIKKDMSEINKALHNEMIITTFIHRDRILQEITAKKRMCSEKLAQCRGATAGTRWIEERTKLVEKECKILGIYSPDRKIIAHIDTAKFTKEEKDKAMKAALLTNKKEIIDVS